MSFSQKFWGPAGGNPAGFVIFAPVGNNFGGFFLEAPSWNRWRNTAAKPRPGKNSEKFRRFFHRLCKNRRSRNTCWKLWVFHILHKVIHNGFPQAAGRNAYLLVYIIFFVRIRQTSYFFSRQKIDNAPSENREKRAWQPRRPSGSAWTAPKKVLQKTEKRDWFYRKDTL